MAREYMLDVKITDIDDYLVKEAYTGQRPSSEAAQIAGDSVINIPRQWSVKESVFVGEASTGDTAFREK